MLLSLIWCLLICLFIICFIVRDKNSNVLKTFGTVCKYVGLFCILFLIWDLKLLLAGVDGLKVYTTIHTIYDSVVNMSIAIFSIVCFYINKIVISKTEKIS